MNEYPNNTQTCFTTLFRNPIILSGKYEVALSEINYSSQFSAELGTIRFVNPFFDDENIFGREEYLQINIKTLNGTSAVDFCKSINNQIYQQCLYKEFQLRLEYAFDDKCKNVERLHKRNFVSTFEFHEPIIPIFKSTSKNFLKKDSQDESSADYKVFLEGEHSSTNLMQVLLESKGGIYNAENKTYNFTSIDSLKSTGAELRILNIPAEQVELNDYKLFLMAMPENRIFDDIDTELRAFLNVLTKATVVPQFVSIPNKLIIEYVNPKPFFMNGLINALCGSFDHDLIISKNFSCSFNNKVSVINQACIYCDVIEEQRIGDTFAPVLQVINLRSTLDGDSITFYDNPAYLVVNKSIINSINIRICDLSGNPILFENLFTFCILKLNFRKRE
jgi:hypothetical protein